MNEIGTAVPTQVFGEVIAKKRGSIVDISSMALQRGHNVPGCNMAKTAIALDGNSVRFEPHRQKGRRRQQKVSAQRERLFSFLTPCCTKTIFVNPEHPLKWISRIKGQVNAATLFGHYRRGFQVLRKTCLAQ